MEKYHYVYKITNLTPIDSKKYYIGVRSSIVIPEEDINYKSSSKYLKEALCTISHSNFIKEILSIWPTRKLAVAEEIRLHNEFDVARNPEYYNKSKQTSTSFDTSGVSFYQSNQVRQQAVSTRKNNNENWHSVETKIKIGDANRGEKNGMSNKPQSDEARRKIKMNNGMNLEENRIKVSKALQGHTVSEETRKKISESKTGSKYSDEFKALKKKQNAGKNNPNSKKFVFTGPNGETHFVEGNLEEFCKSFGLNKDRMSLIARGKTPLVSQTRSKMYGWKCELIPQ